MGCTCFRSAPCHHCLESWECALCGVVEHPEEGGEIIDGSGDAETEYMCSRCLAEVEA